MQILVFKKILFILFSVIIAYLISSLDLYSKSGVCSIIAGIVLLPLLLLFSMKKISYKPLLLPILIIVFTIIQGAVFNYLQLIRINEYAKEVPEQFYNLQQVDVEKYKIDGNEVNVESAIIKQFYDFRSSVVFNNWREVMTQKRMRLFLSEYGPTIMFYKFSMFGGEEMPFYVKEKKLGNAREWND